MYWSDKFVNKVCSCYISFTGTLKSKTYKTFQHDNIRNIEPIRTLLDSVLILITSWMNSLMKYVALLFHLQGTLKSKTFKTYLHDDVRNIKRIRTLFRKSIGLDNILDNFIKKVPISYNSFIHEAHKIKKCKTYHLDNVRNIEPNRTWLDSLLILPVTLNAFFKYVAPVDCLQGHRKVFDCIRWMV